MIVTYIYIYYMYGYIAPKGNWNIFASLMDMPQKTLVVCNDLLFMVTHNPQCFLFIRVMSLGHWVCENNLKGPPNLRHTRHVSTRASPIVGCQKAVILPPNHQYFLENWTGINGIEPSII